MVVTATVVRMASLPRELRATVTTFGWAVAAGCNDLLARRIIGVPGACGNGPRLILLGLRIGACGRLVSDRVVTVALFRCHPWWARCLPAINVDLYLVG